MVVNILKDGIRIDDLQGHVIQGEDADRIRRVIERIERRSDETSNGNA